MKGSERKKRKLMCQPFQNKIYIQQLIEAVMIHRSTVRQYLFILFAVALSACRLGKEYQRPEVELPQQFNSVAYADTSSIADIQWKNFFTTPELQRLIDTGLKYNHDLLIAITRIDIAQQRVRQSKALYFPRCQLPRKH